MLLTILFFYLPLYLVKVTEPYAVQCIFGSASSAPPVVQMVYQQHSLENTSECYLVLFLWVFLGPFLVVLFGSAVCCGVFGAWKFRSWLSDAIFSPAAGGSSSRSTRNVSEPLSLAYYISLAASAKAKADCAAPAMPARPVVKALSRLDLRPPVFFVKPLSGFSGGILDLGGSCRGRAAYHTAKRMLGRAAAGDRRLSLSRGSSLSRGLSSFDTSLGVMRPAELVIAPASTTSSLGSDACPLIMSAASRCRRVGAARRRPAAVSPLRVRGNGRVGKPTSRRASAVFLRCGLTRAVKTADIVGMSAAICLWSCLRSAAASASQLLLVSSCIIKANAGLCLASYPAPPASTTAHLERSAFGGVPHLTVSGRVEKPVVTGAAARKMRRAGVADALCLKQSRLALTDTVASTAAPTSVWPFLAATADSVRGCVPRLPRPARVKKPVAKNATQRRMCRAGAKEALSLHQSRLAAAGAIARAASAAHQKEKAARPIRAISRRRGLASAATTSASHALVAPSALGASASLLSASAVRPVSLMPNIGLTAAASLAQKPFTGGISRGVSLAGVASPALSPKKSSSGFPSRRGIPPLNTTKWNPAVSRAPWQPRNSAS